MIFGAIIAANILLKEINREIFEDSLITKIISKSVLIIVTVILIMKYSLLIKFKLNKSSIFFTILSIIITLIAFFFVRDELLINKLYIDGYKNLQFLLSCFSVGLFEELFFRIFTFLFLLKIFEDDSSKLLKSIISTSLFFGVAHFSNFLNPEYFTLSVINQSLFAISIGVLFQSLYIRFGNLIFIVTLHALINYSGTYKSNFFEVNKNIAINYEKGDFLTALFSISIFSIIVFIVSYFLVGKKNFYSDSNINVKDN